MKQRQLLTLASSILLLASCGGGSQPAATTSNASSGGEASSAQASTSVPSSDPSYAKAPGNYVFPSYTMFSKAEADALPALGEKEIVAFCPVSSGQTNVYNWTRDSGGDHAFASWPGTPMTEKYNDKWFKVHYQGYDDLWIIFNGKGQTRDMHMTHGGYWWFWEADQDIHDTIPNSYFVDTASFIDGKTIRVVTNSAMSSFSLYADNDVVVSGNIDYNALDISLGNHKIDINKKYWIKAKVGEEELTKDVALYSLYGTKEFNAEYAYEGDDLGLTYGKESSTFKVWSPVSSEVNLKIYNTGTPASYGVGGSDEAVAILKMTKQDKGVWSVKVDGDLDGKYYTYEVTNKVYNKKEIVDPYARSTGVNGLRGMILNLEKTNPTGWDTVSPKAIDRKATVVYETHISDLTSASSWNGDAAKKKKFAGFHQTGTSITKNNKVITTGFDHIKELGVNAVQILPMYDQANDERKDVFNWGYNPLNYNVPEGLYSSDPYDGAVRVKELKELIRDYNQAGINIIMDVVYNHVAGAVESNFDVLFPGYFYRYLDNGALSNGSGCGNETASDHYMFRKFMIDSTKYWAKEYKLGGFRFDLMGLHDYETMNELVASVKEVNPSIIIYGEPWQGGTSTMPDDISAKQKNGNKYVGYGQFNDGMRDALIKGGLNKPEATGWATSIEGGFRSEIDAIVDGLKGTTRSDGVIADPDKTVNYVTCHDNYTLHDRIAYNYDGVLEEDDIKAMSKLAQSFVMTSQGTSFMLAGDEFYRSKVLPNGEYDHNSYESSYQVNELDWNLKAENMDTIDMYQKLIALKKNVDGLHLGKDDAAKLDIKVLGSKKNAFTFEIKDTANAKTYKVALQAPFTAEVGDVVELVDAPAIDFTGYSEVYLDSANSGITLSNATHLGFAQVVIAVK